MKEARAHVGQLKKSIHDPGHRTKREAAQLRAAQDRQNRVERALAVMPEMERTKARQTKKRDRKKAPRVSTTVKFGTRTDRAQTMADKVRSVEEKLG